jgi:hypothetical protein
MEKESREVKRTEQRQGVAGRQSHRDSLCSGATLTRASIPSLLCHPPSLSLSLLFRASALYYVRTQQELGRLPPERVLAEPTYTGALVSEL